MAETTTLISDRDLVVAAKAGRREAFESLVRRHERAVRGYLYTLCSNPVTLDELAQGVFVEAYFNLAKLQEGQAFLGWLFGISKNIYLRHRSGRGDRPAPEPELRQETQVLRRRHEFYALVRQCVEQLQDTYREVMALRYFCNMTCLEIAAALERPLSTVTKQISRAHALVAETLQAQQGHATTLGFWLKFPREGKSS